MARDDFRSRPGNLNLRSGRRGGASRRRVVRRLVNMRNLEWFNIGFLVVVLSTTWSDRTFLAVWQRLTVYLLLAGLLAVGGWYWHVKARQIRDRSTIAPELTKLSRIQRAAVLSLIVATIAMVGSWAFQVGFSVDRVWAFVFLAFAWAEYVNYFHYQLMYDNRADLQRLTRSRRLRESHLATDLETWRSDRDCWTR